ncbi:MAG TPA: SH3 domain-containing protein [Pyrinomonadaceae bacterium]|nr:SH3 domain-containing protein [Pyrinomonadaceae bacterium]
MTFQQHHQKPPRKRRNYCLVGCLGIFLILIVLGTLIQLFTGQGRDSSKRTETTQAERQNPNTAKPETLVIIKDNAPMFTEPDAKSRRVIRPNAKAPRTIDRHDEVRVLERKPGWYKVEDLNDVGWVPAEYLASSISDKDLEAIRRERMKVFNETMSQHVKYRHLYAGAEHMGDELTIYVTDNWRRASDDIKRAFIENVGYNWAGLGAVRGLKEDPDELEMKVVHKDSGRTLVTVDSLSGISFK